MDEKDETDVTNGCDEYYDNDNCSDEWKDEHSTGKIDETSDEQNLARRINDNNESIYEKEVNIQYEHAIYGSKDAQKITGNSGDDQQAVHTTEIDNLVLINTCMLTAAVRQLSQLKEEMEQLKQYYINKFENRKSECLACTDAPTNGQSTNKHQDFPVQDNDGTATKRETEKDQQIVGKSFDVCPLQTSCIQEKEQKSNAKSKCLYEETSPPVSYLTRQPPKDGYECHTYPMYWGINIRVENVHLNRQLVAMQNGVSHYVFQTADMQQFCQLLQSLYTVFVNKTQGNVISNIFNACIHSATLQHLQPRLYSYVSLANIVQINIQICLFSMNIYESNCTRTMFFLCVLETRMQGQSVEQVTTISILGDWPATKPISQTALKSHMTEQSDGMKHAHNYPPVVGCFKVTGYINVFLDYYAADISEHLFFKRIKGWRVIPRREPIDSATNINFIYPLLQQGITKYMMEGAPIVTSIKTSTTTLHNHEPVHCEGKKRIGCLMYHQILESGDSKSKGCQRNRDKPRKRIHDHMECLDIGQMKGRVNEECWNTMKVETHQPLGSTHMNGTQGEQCFETVDDGQTPRAWIEMSDNGIVKQDHDKVIYTTDTNNATDMNDDLFFSILQSTHSDHISFQETDDSISERDTKAKTIVTMSSTIHDGQQYVISIHLAYGACFNEGCRIQVGEGQQILLSNENQSDGVDTYMYRILQIKKCNYMNGQKFCVKKAILQIDQDFKVVKLGVLQASHEDCRHRHCQKLEECQSYILTSRCIHLFVDDTIYIQNGNNNCCYATSTEYCKAMNDDTDAIFADVHSLERLIDIKKEAYYIVTQVHSQEPANDDPLYTDKIVSVRQNKPKDAFDSPAAGDSVENRGTRPFRDKSDDSQDTDALPPSSSIYDDTDLEYDVNPVYDEYVSDDNNSETNQRFRNDSQESAHFGNHDQDNLHFGNVILSNADVDINNCRGELGHFCDAESGVQPYCQSSDHNGLPQLVSPQGHVALNDTNKHLLETCSQYSNRCKPVVGENIYEAEFNSLHNVECVAHVEEDSKTKSVWRIQEKFLQDYGIHFVKSYVEDSVEKILESDNVNLRDVELKSFAYKLG